MITEEKLAELRKELGLSRNQTMMLCPRSFDVDEALDTLSALWRVYRAAEEAAPFIGIVEAKRQLTNSLAALREGKEKKV